MKAGKLRELLGRIDSEYEISANPMGNLDILRPGPTPAVISLESGREMICVGVIDMRFDHRIEWWNDEDPADG